MFNIEHGVQLKPSYPSSLVLSNPFTVRVRNYAKPKSKLQLQLQHQSEIENLEVQIVEIVQQIVQQRHQKKLNLRQILLEEGLI